MEELSLDNYGVGYGIGDYIEDPDDITIEISQANDKLNELNVTVLDLLSTLEKYERSIKS